MNMFRRRDQRGAAAVEFALVLPIVVVILAGIFEFGMGMWRKQVLTAAVREGARYGITVSRPNSSQISAKVKQYLTDMQWDAGPANVTTTGAGGAANTNLKVSATYPTSFSLLSKLQYGGVATSSVQLKASVTMTLE